jgi:hypothetical protein
VSFMLDVKIIFWTIQKVVGRKDISQEGHATMPRFTGSQPAYIMTDLMKEVLISEKDWNATPGAVRSACQVMANRISVLDRQLEHATTEREIYRTQMLDMKARLDAALSMLQLNVRVDTSMEADTWLDEVPVAAIPPYNYNIEDEALLRIVNKTVVQDQPA